MRLALAALVAMIGSGCATMSPRAHAENFKLDLFGEAMEVRELNAAFKASMAKTFESMNPADVAGMAKSVKVLEKSLPDGIEVKDGVIKSSPESNLTVVGKFAFQPAFGNTGWFADYDSGLRKALCYPQVPLTWVTLVMWQVFVPLSWPCISGKLPVEQGYGYMRVAAEALHANTVVIVLGNTDEFNFYGAIGFILKEREDAPKGPPAAKDASSI